MKTIKELEKEFTKLLNEPLDTYPTAKKRNNAIRLNMVNAQIQTLKEVLKLIEEKDKIILKFYSEARKKGDEHFADSCWHSHSTLDYLKQKIEGKWK